MSRFNRTKLEGELKYTYLIGFKYVWNGEGSFEKAEEWVEQYGDCSYNFLNTTIPIEEFSPDEFEYALSKYIAESSLPDNIFVVPTLIQRLRYSAPTDDNSNVTKIPISLLGDKNA